jgi:hypothetical protein
MPRDMPGTGRSGRCCWDMVLQVFLRPFAGIMRLGGRDNWHPWVTNKHYRTLSGGLALPRAPR